MQEGILLYNLISLFAGVSATFVVWILYLRTRNGGLVPFIVMNVLFALVIAGCTYELYAKLMGRYDTLPREIVHELIQACILGLCVPVTRLSRPRIRGRLVKTVELGFAAVTSLIAAAFAAYFIFSRDASLYTAIYICIYADLCLAILYFGLSSLLFRKPRRSVPALRNWEIGMGFLRALSLAILPAFIPVDFFGYLIPPLGAILPQDAYVLPAFYLSTSLLMMVGTIKDILAREPESGLMAPTDEFVDRFGLTRREAEVIPLVLEFLSYREIGDRLFVSVGTVRTHLIHIYRKTGARNRLELARLIRRESRS